MFETMMSSQVSLLSLQTGVPGRRAGSTRTALLKTKIWERLAAAMPPANIHLHLRVLKLILEDELYVSIGNPPN